MPNTDSYIISSRQLLSLVRNVMAGPSSPQKCLDQIVSFISSEMNADVCSCYVMRAGRVLELFSSTGLNPKSVHATWLEVGEGIIGQIAETAKPLMLPDAKQHSHFADRPETGEGKLTSLCGVPIIHTGHVRGVLTVQSMHERTYTEEEIEVLETVSMILAELIVSRNLISETEIATGRNSGLLTSRLKGFSFSRGLAMGTAILHKPQMVPNVMISDDPKAEVQRLKKALHQMNTAIDFLLEKTRSAGQGEHQEILETYKMFAEDHGWVAKIKAVILQGLSAEVAVQRVQNDVRIRMAQISDPYFRERFLDFEDLTNRLLHHLSGHASTASMHDLPEDTILIARSMGPAELLDYDRKSLRALILEEGSPTSHVSIVARSLEIPLIGRCTGILSHIQPFDHIIVDGAHANVFIRPSEEIIQVYRENITLQKKRRQLYKQACIKPSVTLDGTEISMYITGLSADIPKLHETNAEGVGLFRTEIPFMTQNEYPSVETQTQIYKRILNRADGKPVTFRTLDIGSDKWFPYFPKPQEDNPALGWRALRVGLDNPAMLRGQLRALLAAAASEHQELRVLFPMAAKITEIEDSKDLLNREIKRAETRGQPLPSSIKVGVMLEVPSLIWQLDNLFLDIDFISIGTNDLLQYVYAADRNDADISARYDSLSVPMMKILEHILKKCQAANVPVNVCGEMPAKPLEALALITLGFQNLSVTPQAIGAVKAMLQTLNIRLARPYLKRMMNAKKHSFREELRNFARDHKILI